MKVTFKNSYNIPSVFNDVSRPSYNNTLNTTAPVKADSVELKSKKIPFYKNKRLIFFTGVILVSALAILYSSICKKNANKAIDEFKAFKALPKYLQVQQDDVLVKQVNIAREHLIEEVQENKETLFNSVSFFGPDSANKTMVKEGLIKELSDAGYYIERIPELKDSTIEKIGLKIDKAIKSAKRRFDSSGQRTAIIIKDLDKIAPDRLETGIYKAARPLLNHLQDCGKQGFTVVADEYNPLKVDPAVIRRGRFSLHIYTKPLVNESKEMWEKYIDFVKEYVNKNDQKAYIDEALEIIRKK